MSRAASILVAAAALGASTAAGAAPAVPAFDAIAQGAFPALPDRGAAPASVPAGERVEGLVVEAMKPWRGQIRRHVNVHAEGRQCLYTLTGWLDALEEAPSSKGVTMSVHAGVMPMRQERLIEAPDGSAALEVADLWVDPATLGARVHATTRVPLTRLAGGPGEFAVHGLRAGGVLHVVAPTERPSVFRDGDGGVRSVECGHVRVPLEVQPEAGSMALIGAFPKRPPAPIPRVDANEDRQLAVHVSLSQVSRDPAPVLGVTIAWARTGGDEPMRRGAEIEAE